MYPPPRSPNHRRTPSPAAYFDYSFQPQRAFVPPSLPKDDSTGSMYLADMSSVILPAVVDIGPAPEGGVVRCNVCQANVTLRPRVQCLLCKDYDVCADCHTFRRLSGSHRISHPQETLCPREYPPSITPNHSAEYQCDCCGRDLTYRARAHCTSCKNYDLCLDCNLSNQTTEKHRLNHNINVVTSHLSPSPRLMDDSYTPTSLLEKLLPAIFAYIDSTFAPLETGLLEPGKLSAFFSAMGVDPALNPGRRTDAQIAAEYSTLRCEYLLVPNNRDAIAARQKPWSRDALDTTPRAPSLTVDGWIRYYVELARKNTDLAFFILAGALATGGVLGKRGVPYRLSVGRDCFPILEKSRSRSKSLERRRSGSMPGEWR